MAKKLEALAKERGVTVPELLADEYREKGSQKEVAKALGVAPSTIRYALMANNMEERTVIVHRSYDRRIQLTEAGREALKGE